MSGMSLVWLNRLRCWLGRRRWLDRVRAQGRRKRQGALSPYRVSDKQCDDDDRHGVDREENDQNNVQRFPSSRTTPRKALPCSKAAFSRNGQLHPPDAQLSVCSDSGIN